MEEKEKRGVKPIVFTISAAVTALVLLLYFLDTSLGWNAYKIVSCVAVNLWVFSFPPSFRFEYLKIKSMGAEEGMRYSAQLGLSFVAGTMLCVLLAPVYAVKYYFVK